MSQDDGGELAPEPSSSVAGHQDAFGARDRPYVPLAVPNIGVLEQRYVSEAVQSGFVSSVGPFVSRFEETFAETVGTQHAVACSTGTAALHISLILLGVQRNDEVAVSDFTFVGSANPVAYLGARPLLVDSERTTWNLDQALLIDELKSRVRRGMPLPTVVEVVHVLGQPAETSELLEVCARFGVHVLEDAAESLGATWSLGALAGRHTGTAGRVGAFSFNGNKIVTSGGGGMIVTDDPALASRARHLTTQAKIPDVGYLHDEVGYNYRLTNLAAAVGQAQIERLSDFVKRKREIAARYDAAFAHTALTLPPRVPGLDSTYWLYSVLAPGSRPDARHGRDALLAHLARHQIGARALWRPLRSQPPFRDSATLGGGVGGELFDRGVSLPCSTDLTWSEQSQVIDAILSFEGTAA